MKLLGIDTSGVKLVGKFTFTNTTEFAVVVSLWQTGPLYYRVVLPGQTWATECGSVWFTIKVWLYNGENNINPGIKYSLLAGNIVGFAALGAVGLTATAVASSYGVSKRNPDWEEWLKYNHLQDALSDVEIRRGISAIPKCDFSGTGYYAGKHPHLYISGGPVVNASPKTSDVTLDWHEIRVDKCAFDNITMPLIMVDLVHEPDLWERYEDKPRLPARKTSDLGHHVDLVNHEETSDAPSLPHRPESGAHQSVEVVPILPKRPGTNTTTSPGLSGHLDLA